MPSRQTILISSSAVKTGRTILCNRCTVISHLVLAVSCKGESRVPQTCDEPDLSPESARDDTEFVEGFGQVYYRDLPVIVRSSWGTNWGDGGFAHASNACAKAAFTEAYGAVL